MTKHLDPMPTVSPYRNPDAHIEHPDERYQSVPCDVCGYDPTAAFNDGFAVGQKHAAGRLRMLADDFEKRSMKWSRKASEYSRERSEPRHHKAARARSIVYQKCAMELKQIVDELEAQTAND